MCDISERWLVVAETEDMHMHRRLGTLSQHWKTTLNVKPDNARRFICLRAVSIELKINTMTIRHEGDEEKRNEQTERFNNNSWDWILEKEREQRTDGRMTRTTVSGYGGERAWGQSNEHFERLRGEKTNTRTQSKHIMSVKCDGTYRLKGQVIW